MSNTCKDCRFFNCTKCAKFSVITNESYPACKDFANKIVIQESSNKKIKLYD